MSVINQSDMKMRMDWDRLRVEVITLRPVTFSFIPVGQ